MSTRSTSVERPLRLRSRLTNDPLRVGGLDGRSAAARRFRDLVSNLADDVGGQDKINESTKILVRQAAALTVQVESLQGKIVASEDINLEQLTRLSNVLGRTLARLGLRKPAPKQRTLQDYMAERSAAKAASGEPAR